MTVFDGALPLDRGDNVALPHTCECNKSSSGPTFIFSRSYYVRIYSASSFSSNQVFSQVVIMNPSTPVAYNMLQFLCHIFAVPEMHFSDNRFESVSRINTSNIS